ncbi:MAG: YfhO family protein [Chloroflexota bacterium]|nr:YfhO family protein [Chloroflexota bacterium]
MRRCLNPDLAAVIALVVCALALHRDGLLGGAAFYERDTQLFYYPLARWVGEQLRAGVYPLWLPAIFTGYPIFADGELGLLNVPQVAMLLWMPTPLAMVWLRILHTVIAGALTLWFLRTLGLGTSAALAGGLVFAFGSFLTAQMHHENLVRSAVWLPALLTCLARAASSASRRRAAGWTALGSVAFAQACFGLHVQPVLMTALALAGYGVFLAVAERARARWALLSASAMLLAGVVAASAQWLPLAEWAVVSSRRTGVEYDFASAFGLAPQNLPTLLFPFFFRLPDNATWWSLWQPWETELYVGIPTLALVLIGVVFGRRKEVLYFVVLGGCALLVGMAQYAPVNVHQLLWSVPGFSFLRAPGRFSYLVVFACAGLAAVGLQVLVTARARRLVAAVAAWPSLAVLAALLALLPTWRRALAEDPGTARAWVESAYLATRAQFPIDPNLVIGGMLWSLDLANPKTTWSLALLLLTALTFGFWLAVGARRAVFGRVALVGLVAVDLLTFSYDFHPRARLAELAPTLPEAVSVGERVLLHAPTDLPNFEPNQPQAVGVATVQGYSSLPSQRHVELEAQTQLQPNLFDLWSEQVILEPVSPADARTVDGVHLRLGHPLVAGFGGGTPSAIRVPANLGAVEAVRLVGTLSYAFDVPQGTPVASLEVAGAQGPETIPVRAGIELAERAYDRPSLAGLLAHQRAHVALDFEEATPQGEAYVAHLYAAETRLSAALDARTITFTAGEPRVLVQIHGLAVRTASGLYSFDLADRDGLRRLSPTAIANDRRLPRAYVLPRTHAFSLARHPGLTATQLVASPDMDVRREVLIEGDADAPPRPAEDGPEAIPSRLVELGPNALEIVANADVPSYLVVTDFYHRGWSAWVDGRPSPVLIANALFRAVALEPGQHMVELRFEPLSHLVGAVISTVALLALLVVVGWGLGPTRADR